MKTNLHQFSLKSYRFFLMSKTFIGGAMCRRVRIGGIDN